MVAASEGQNVQRDRIGEEGGEPALVAGDVIFGELCATVGRDREIHERDQRQRLGGRVVDRDFVGRAELLQHQHVGVGEQHVEAFDHEDRQRHREPDARTS